MGLADLLARLSAVLLMVLLFRFYDHPAKSRGGPPHRPRAVCVTFAGLKNH
jgi:hypothetical protein